MPHKAIFRPLYQQNYSVKQDVQNAYANVRINNKQHRLNNFIKVD